MLRGQQGHTGAGSARKVQILGAGRAVQGKKCDIQGGSLAAL